MPIEHEIKLRCPDPAAMRTRLAALGAEPRGTVCERNELFDTAVGRLRSADCGLRLRIQRPATPTEVGAGGCNWAGGAHAGEAILTFKGPRTGGGVKVREELETTIGDAEALRAVLARLEYAPVVVYEKLRETWALGPPAGTAHPRPCVVTLDTLPNLGTWLEIEGPDTQAVLALQQMLGLASAAPEQRTYVEMAATHGRRDAAGCRHLTFEPVA